ncbi:hypothetical protein ACGFZP_33860 [Kitasatospora sp. NPDC048239]|uniref:hypothetical protein n=1 Tax=Kitasatospora sp. NPDC048239 TaxID=3364046 RepID=UPI003720AD21
MGVDVVMRRGSAYVVFDVDLGKDGEPALPDWAEGPLPVADRDGGVVDRARRMTYFEPRVAESLYGSPERPARWHRRLTAAGTTGTAEPTPTGRVVEGVELLCLPAVFGPGAERRGLAVLHVRLSADPLTDLAELADLTASGAAYTRELPEGVRIAASGRRPWTLCHVTFADGTPPEPLPPPYAGWGARDQWLWLLASATPLSRFPPDPEDTALFDGRVRFSADWQALVLRDGAAFLGTSPDPGGDAVFHAGAAVLVRTIYLDTFLLGRLQVLGLNRLANSLAGMTAQDADANRLLALEGRLIELRRALWSSHITTRAKANELLERFQEQHRLAHLLAATGSGLADAARYVDAARSRRSALALGLLSAVGLPFGVAYAAGALWGDPAPATLLVCTLAALAAAALLFALLPPLRGLASGELRGRAGGPNGSGSNGGGRTRGTRSDRDARADDPHAWED